MEKVLLAKLKYTENLQLSRLLWEANQYACKDVTIFTQEIRAMS